MAKATVETPPVSSLDCPATPQSASPCFRAKRAVTSVVGDEEAHDFWLDKQTPATTNSPIMLWLL